MSTTYYDYRYKFPATQAALTKALGGFAALQAAALLGAGDIPTNMLGDPRDSTGAINRDKPTWFGAPGRPASSYTDPTTKQTVPVPAAGDPASYYVAIRATVAPADVPVDPSAYGLAVCDPVECAAVLGTWA